MSILAGPDPLPDIAVPKNMSRTDAVKEHCPFVRISLQVGQVQEGFCLPEQLFDRNEMYPRRNGHRHELGEGRDDSFSVPCLLEKGIGFLKGDNVLSAGFIATCHGQIEEKPWTLLEELSRKGQDPLRQVLSSSPAQEVGSQALNRGCRLGKGLCFEIVFQGVFQFVPSS